MCKLASGDVIMYHKFPFLLLYNAAYTRCTKVQFRVFDVAIKATHGAVQVTTRRGSMLSGV